MVTVYSDLELDQFTEFIGNGWYWKFFLSLFFVLFSTKRIVVNVIFIWQLKANGLLC